MPGHFQTVGDLRRAGSRTNRRYLVVYLVVLVVLLGGVLTLTSRLGGYRDQAVDFFKLPREKVIVTADLTRRQIASIKLGFLESSDPPEVGMFGNHVFQFFNLEDFAVTDRRYFYNYWYANLSLSELRDLISHAASIGKLPTKTILVQLTTPNNDNGLNVIGYRGELPFELISLRQVGSFRDFVSQAEELTAGLFAELYFRLAYSSAIISLNGVRNQTLASRILNEPDCARKRLADAPPLTIGNSVLDRMPMRARFMLASADTMAAYWSGQFCNVERMKDSLRFDGSTNPRYLGGELVRDENPLGAIDRNINQRVLRSGDEAEVASLLMQIDKIGRDAGRRVVFIVPPVYESERASIVDTIFSRALRLAPQVTMIDHRGMRDDPANFVHYDHPSQVYFRKLVAELRAKGLVP